MVSEGLRWNIHFLNTYNVLILVLVEDGLGARLVKVYTTMAHFVLILVLVEDGLGEDMKS